MIEMGFSSLPPFQVNYYFCAGSACAGWPCAGCFAGGVPPRFCSHVQPPRFRRHANLVWHLLTALIRTRPTQQWERVPQNPWNFGRSSRSSTAMTIELLHRNRDVRVPRDVNLVANLNLIEHSRIDDMSAVFPSVRTNEGDRRCVLVDSVDGRGHRSLHGCRAPRSFPLPRSGGPGLRINRCLARRLQSRGDVVVIRHRYLVPDLELIEPLRACGHVDRLEAAIGFLDVHGALLMIDGRHGARKGDGLCRELFDLLRPAGQGKSQDQPVSAQDRVYSLHVLSPLG